jgi:hypothetical protein
MNLVRSLRLTASFALLGAIIAGIFAGLIWRHNPSFDPRWVGAAIGAAASIFAQVAHLV